MSPQTAALRPHGSAACAGSHTSHASDSPTERNGVDDRYIEQLGKIAERLRADAELLNLHHALSHKSFWECANSCKLVWAQVKGHPWWPARLLSSKEAKMRFKDTPAGYTEKRMQTHHAVTFFQTDEISWLQDKQIKSFSDGLVDGCHAKLKTNKAFRTALKLVASYPKTSNLLAAVAANDSAGPGRDAAPACGLNAQARPERSGKAWDESHINEPYGEKPQMRPGAATHVTDEAPKMQPVQEQPLVHQARQQAQDPVAVPQHALPQQQQTPVLATPSPAPVPLLPPGLLSALRQTPKPQLPQEDMPVGDPSCRPPQAPDGAAGTHGIKRHTRSQGDAELNECDLENLDLKRPMRKRSIQTGLLCVEGSVYSDRPPSLPCTHPHAPLGADAALSSPPACMSRPSDVFGRERGPPVTQTLMTAAMNSTDMSAACDVAAADAFAAGCSRQRQHRDGLLDGAMAVSGAPDRPAPSNSAAPAVRPRRQDSLGLRNGVASAPGELLYVGPAGSLKNEVAKEEDEGAEKKRQRVCNGTGAGVMRLASGAPRTVRNGTASTAELNRACSVTGAHSPDAPQTRLRARRSSLAGTEAGEASGVLDAKAAASRRTLSRCLSEQGSGRWSGKSDDAQEDSTKRGGGGGASTCRPVLRSRNGTTTRWQRGAEAATAEHSGVTCPTMLLHGHANTMRASPDRAAGWPQADDACISSARSSCRAACGLRNTVGSAALQPADIAAIANVLAEPIRLAMSGSPAEMRLPLEVLLLREQEFKTVAFNKYPPELKPRKQRGDLIQVCSCSRSSDAEGTDMYCCRSSGCANRAAHVVCDPRSCPCRGDCDNRPFNLRAVPKTDVIATENRGHGLAAAEAIAANTFVGEYTGEVITEATASERAAEAIEQQLLHCYALELGKGLLLDATRMGSRMRYMNSSCTPNCELQRWRDAATAETRIGIFTTRPIAAGEELTHSWIFHLHGLQAAAEGLRCLCGSSKCQGVAARSLSGADDVGRRLRVKWDDDDAWYEGHVLHYCALSGMHTVLYPWDGAHGEGSQETLALREVDHEWIDRVSEQFTFPAVAPRPRAAPACPQDGAVRPSGSCAPGGLAVAATLRRYWRGGATQMGAEAQVERSVHEDGVPQEAGALGGMEARVPLPCPLPVIVTGPALAACGGTRMLAGSHSGQSTDTSVGGLPAHYYPLPMFACLAKLDPPLPNSYPLCDALPVADCPGDEAATMFVVRNDAVTRIDDQNGGMMVGEECEDKAPTYWREHASAAAPAGDFLSHPQRVPTGDAQEKDEESTPFFMPSCSVQCPNLCTVGI